MAAFRIAAGLALFFLSLFGGAGELLAKAKKGPERWVVYYGNELKAESFMPYDLIIFDRQAHPPLRPLINRNKTLLAYLSVGEADNARDDFETLKSMGLLLEENPQWPGRYIVDIRDPAWGKYLIEEILPSLLHKHFDGVMLDTLDSPLHLETRDPEAFAGMKEAAIALIHAIRLHYPEIKIMLNRGFEVLEAVAPTIDAVLAESILVNYQPESESYSYFADDIYARYVEQLKAVQQISPGLKIYALDYWPQDDLAKIKEIYHKQRSHGFVPYVSTVDLRQIYAEPN